MFTNIVLLVYVIYCPQELAIYALFPPAVNNTLLVHNWKCTEQVLLDDGYQCLVQWGNQITTHQEFTGANLAHTSMMADTFNWKYAELKMKGFANCTSVWYSKVMNQDTSMQAYEGGSLWLLVSQDTSCTTYVYIHTTVPTLSCRSGFAPAPSRSSTTLWWPLLLALFRAVQPSCMVEWE